MEVVSVNFLIIHLPKNIKSVILWSKIDEAFNLEKVETGFLIVTQDQSSGQCFEDSLQFGTHPDSCDGPDALIPLL